MATVRRGEEAWYYGDTFGSNWARTTSRWLVAPKHTIR